MTTPAADDGAGIVVGNEIRASETWPACLNWPLLGCLCRGAAQNGGNTCIRKRERDQARALAERERDRVQALADESPQIGGDQ